MAKISNAERYFYIKRITAYREAIEAILEREKTILTEIQGDPENAAVKRLALVDEMLDLASHYIIVSTISQSMLKTKNEEALNDGRKALYKGIIYLEETVSNLVDAPFSEYEDKLAGIESMDAARRYLLIRKLGLGIDLLENAYGDNTKWRWSFVDLEGRYAAVAKNILDLRKVVVNTDPRSPFYEPTIYHLRLVKQLLGQAAARYRQMYELSTHRIDDFRMGIHFLDALRRIHALLGEREEAEQIKKKSDIWSAKLEADLKKRSDPLLKRQDAKVVS
ncbi:hypothetical protein LQZ21_11980 [Treponema sp. TIM-1]|uniref:hypothetical protein n=1 Tax=Treponema sp. TIM-1 TaxID=2898417 RepID=UPI00397FFA67